MDEQIERLTREINADGAQSVDSGADAADLLAKPVNAPDGRKV